MSAARLSPDALIDAFALDRHRYLYLIGGGGKTSLMLAVAGALSARGHRVITTTSTKLLVPDATEADEVIIESDPATLVERLIRRPAGPRRTMVGKALIDGGAKIGGFATSELDEMRSAAGTEYWLVEGDGSAGRSLKAHLDHEPVVSTQADLIIAVVGIDCVGQPATDAYVQRAERFRSLLGRAGSAPITIDDVAGIILHPLGYLAKVSARSAVTVFISKAGGQSEDNAARGTARLLAHTLHAADTGKRIDRIVIGEVCTRRQFVEVTA